MTDALRAAERSGHAHPALGRLMLAFDGLELPEPMRRRLTSAPAAGVTLFRYRNVGTPEQVRGLTAAIQACAADGLPFLVAADQEGGQLLGLGSGSTPFPGNMALGAADDPDLTRRVGAAIGTELRALGVNVDYAPVSDLATNRLNPALGVRSFGDDADRVARHVAAFVEGLEASGVAATLKHFPGKGDAGVDTHHQLARVGRTLAQLHARELRPFVAGIEADASLVMSGHFAIPALTGDLPATLSEEAMGDLLRERLRFGGVTISDSFDMNALSPGDGRLDDAVRGLNAGLDLILLGGDSDVASFDTTLRAAAASGALDLTLSASALERVRRLRQRLGDVAAPELGIVGGGEHRALASEVAQRALTVLRDRDALLPLRPSADDRILVVMPRPEDLTPADTSAAEPARLVEAFRRRHPNVEELRVGHVPDRAEVARAADRARGAWRAVVATIDASRVPEQATLVAAVLGTGTPTVTAAVRTPWDLAVYPAAGTHVCTYSIVEPALDALAAACFGEITPAGCLPVTAGVEATA